MKITIIGAGGVGGYFGGKLAKAGYDVTFVVRGAHLQAMTNSGLTVKSILGDFLIPQPKVTDKITNLDQPDLILLAVKAWQIKEIRNDLKSIIHSSSIILPLQNGILAADELAEEINNENILYGLCRIISKIEEPGVINHFAINPSIAFGESGNLQTGRTATIKEIFNRAGIESYVPTDIKVELWKKFIGICVGGLLAITRSNYGELRSVPETRQMIADLLNEVYLLSQKEGIAVKDDFVDKTMAAIDTFPFDSTTSLARDIWEGKPSEIDYQNGTVVNLAHKHNVYAPVNTFIYNCIRPMELRVRRKNQK